MELGLEPNRSNSRSGILNHGILLPLNQWKMVYGLWAQTQLRDIKTMSAFPGTWDCPARSSSGVLQPKHSFTFQQKFQTIWEHTGWITAHNLELIDAWWRWKTGLCHLNRQKMEDFSVYFDKCKWIQLLVKMLSRPQWNELLFFLFRVKGMKKERNECSRQTALIWNENKQL